MEKEKYTQKSIYSNVKIVENKIVSFDKTNAIEYSFRVYKDGLAGIHYQQGKMSDKEGYAKAEKNLEKVKISDEETDIVCEQCGRHMVIKYGPHGKFLACPGFPECRNTKSYNEKTEYKCPKCGADILLMKSRKGRRYYSCEKYPDCDYMSWQKPENV